MSEEIDIQDREAREAAEKAAEYEHGWSSDIETEFAEEWARVGDVLAASPKRCTASSMRATRL